MSGTAESRRPRWQAWAVAGLVAGILVAMVTIWPPNLRPDRVDELDYRVDAFYVRVSSSDRLGQARWARSDDGGLTWTGVDKSEVPRVVPSRTSNPRCAADDVCYRRNDEGYNVERGDEQQGWAVEYTSEVILTELAVNPGNSAQAMLIVDWQRIVRRAPDGTWSVMDVAAATTPPMWREILDAVQHSQLALVGVGAVLCLLGARRYGAAGRARGIWIGLNILVGVGLSHLTAAREGPTWTVWLWFSVGLAILALPVPPRDAPVVEEDLR